MVEKGYCDVINKSKGKLPSLPFDSIKEKILGPKYKLELIFLTPNAQKKINSKYRNIDTTTNILSFPLSSSLGQIIMDPIKIRGDATLFGMTYPKFLKYLFIHGLLHLKGFEHSSKMEREEKKYLKFFS